MAHKSLPHDRPDAFERNAFESKVDFTKSILDRYGIAEFHSIGLNETPYHQHTDVPTRSEMNPNQYQHEVLIFGHPRSGSTNLNAIVDSHPQIRLLEEPFNEDYIRWFPDARDHHRFVRDVPSLHAEVAHILQDYDGFKMLDYQLADRFIEALFRRPAMRIIFLFRRNLLQTIVSLLIAHQTQLWHTRDITGSQMAYYADLQPLDPNEVMSRMIALRAHMAWCLETLQRCAPERHLVLTYEDLYTSSPPTQAAILKSLWAFLRLAPPETAVVQSYIDPSVSRLNSRATYARVPGIESIQQQCGSDEMGWLWHPSTSPTP